MTAYRITSSSDLGVYDGATPLDAYRAMMADAGYQTEEAAQSAGYTLAQVPVDVRVEEVLSLTWHVAPEDQGQMVEVAYATDRECYVYRRTTDRSDRSVAYERADIEAVVEFAPWNTRPSVPADAWESVTEAGVLS